MPKMRLPQLPALHFSKPMKKRKSEKQKVKQAKLKEKDENWEFSLKKVKRPTFLDVLASKLLVLGDPISHRMPFLKIDLLQAQMTITPREFVSKILATTIFYAIIFLFLLLLLSKIVSPQILFFLLLIFIAFFAFMIFSSLLRPRIIARRRMRLLETNLVPALRHLLVEIRSGVPLFQSMTGISTGYGEVSSEFKKIVNDVNAGIDETDALTEATKRNPSFQFRRAIWQITNALKSGSDVGDALEAIIDDLTKEQLTAIRRYGQELNPWTMIYMTVAVIIPSLGVTFLVIMTSFSSALVPTNIFSILLGGLVAFQLVFLNFIKSKRPPV